jgi:hypothetical protein
MVLNFTMTSIAATAAAALTVAALLVTQVRESLAHSGTKEEQDACTPDVFRLCSAAIPDEPRIVACLNRNLSKLSPACRSVMSGGPVAAKSRSER